MRTFQKLARRGASAILVLVLAGCVEVPADLDLPPAASGSIDLPDAREFNSTFELRLTEARSPNSHDARGTNCASVASDGLRIVDGAASASWSAQSSMAQRLTLRVDEGWERTIAEQRNRPSPVSASFSDVSRETDRSTFDFIVMLDETGVVVDQQVTLTVRFTYVGPEDIQPRVGGCGRA